MAKPRFNAGKVLIGVAVVIAVVLAVGFVVTQFARPLLNGPIASITFDQSASIPNYDGATYTITDADRLAEFEALAERHAVIPELVSVSTIANDCTGGTGTTAEIVYESGRVGSLHIYRCGENDGVYGAYVSEVTSLLSSWKDKD